MPALFSFRNATCDRDWDALPLAARGLTRGYPYRRIEDAYYAWRAEIRASAQGRAPVAKVCQTLEEFTGKSTGSETLAVA